MKTLSLLCALSLALVPLAPTTHAKDEKIGHTLGAISMEAMMAQYFAIAELADLLGNKAYDEQKVIKVGTLLGTLANEGKKALTDLSESGELDEADTTAISTFIRIHGLLGKMADSVVAFAKDPTDENEAAFKKNRDLAWAAMEKFM